MMVATGWLGGHPEAGELLCFADRSLPAVEHERLSSHIAECEHCQRELAAIETQSRSISAAMYSVDAEPVSDIRRALAWRAVSDAAKRVERRRRMKTVWLPRIAAASLVFVVAGPGFALVRSLLERNPEITPEITPAVVSDAPLSIVASASYKRPWSRADFTVEFSSEPRGSLEFGAEVAQVARFEILGVSSPRAGMSSAGVSIDNDVSSAPAYRLFLPEGVKTVTVRVAGKAPITIAPKAGMRIDLQDLARGQPKR